MKKQLLIAGLVFGSLISNAQTSFETSEGYALGNISGQNSWTTSAAANSSTVSNTYAQTGTNSLKIAGNNGTVHTLVGAFSPVLAVTNEVVTASMGIYFSPLNANGSDFQVLIQSPSQQKLTSRIVFSYDGSIRVLDSSPIDPTALNYVDTEKTFVGGQWYTFKVIHNFSTSTIEYYLDDVLFYTGSAFGATNVEQIVLLNDNYDSTAYFDNIQVVGTTLGVNTENLVKFAIYPNPATDIVNVSNVNNVNVSNVIIADINGRTVKQKSFGSVSSDNLNVNISDLSAGVYMMTINSDQGSVTKKIVKN